MTVEREQSPMVMIVEDDPSLRMAIAASLGSHEFTTREASSAELAIVLVEDDPPDLVVLDLNLPGMDGLQALHRLRGFTTIPVIVVTVRDSKEDKLTALDGGADDYVTKPFDVDELLARVRAALRRASGTRTTPTLTIGDVEIDFVRDRVLRGGVEVRLTPSERQFLEILVRSDGRLVTQGQVARSFSPARGGTLDPQAMRVLVGQLRKKLGDDAAEPRMILTHHGVGYRWIGNANDGGA